MLPSGDPKVRVLFECVEYWHQEVEKWAPIPGGRATRGEWFLVKKTGHPNEKVVQMLCVHLGWSGDLRQIHGTPPQDGLVQVRVKSSEWNGKTYFNADWVLAADANPMATAAAGPAAPDQVDVAMQKHGKAFLAAAAKFANAKPQASAAVGDDIPF